MSRLKPIAQGFRLSPPISINPVPLSERSDDPASIVNTGQLYTKEVATITELFYIDDAGNVTQMTESGVLGGDEFHLDDDEYLRIGNTTASPDARFGWNTTQTVDALFLGLSDGQNTFVIAENGDRAFDFAHGAATNPTLFIHSAAQSTTQYISLSHNQTDAVILTGTGDLLLNIAGGNLAPSANDGFALGTTALGVADIFLATGSVINWVAGDITLTHSAGKLTFGGDGAVELDFNNNEMTNVDIDSGAIDNTAIGATTPAAGTFTTLSASSVGLSITVTNTTDAASLQLASFRARRATVADNDEGYISLLVRDDLGSNTEFARITWVATDVNVGTSLDGRLDFSVMTAGTLAKELQLTGTALSPSTNDGLALGVATDNMWSDLFLASGSVIDFNAGDITITHSANALAFAGGSGAAYSFDATVYPASDGGGNLGTATLSWGSLFLDTGGAINFDNSDVTLTHASNALTFAGGDFFVADGNGVIVGHTAQLTTEAVIAEFQVLGTAAADSTVTIFRGSLDASGPILYFAKSRDAIGTFTTDLSVDDSLGEIRFTGSDGTDADLGGHWARIAAFVDAAAAGSNDHPGRLVFYTTANAADTATERMRITSGGLVGIGVTPTELFHVQTTGTGNVTGTIIGRSTANSGDLSSLIFDTADIGNQVSLDAITASGTTGSLAFRVRSASALTERMRLLNGGNLVFGNTTSSNFIGVNPLVDVNALTTGQVIAMHKWSADANGGYFNLGKSRGAAAGTYTAPNSADTLGTFAFSGADNGASRFEVGAQIVADASEAWSNTAHGTDMKFYTVANTSETITQRMTILNSGVVTIGGTLNTAYGTNGKNFEINATATYGGISLNTWSATADEAALIDFQRSKSATIGTHSIVASADRLGSILFRGSNGTSFNTAAAIRGWVDAAPGAANDMPGRIDFQTTPDGSSSPSERMRINNAGVVSIGDQTNTGQLEVYAADNSAGALKIRINAAQASITAADVFVSFASTSGEEGTIAGTGVGGVLAYNTWTASHWSQSNSIEKHTVERLSHYREVAYEDELGNPVYVEKTKTVIAYESELEMCSVLVSIEEMSYWEGEIAAHLPKCKVSDKPMDKMVYGAYGGHDKDGDILVLSGGVGYVLVTDEGGEIEAGDLLCTSSTPGHAMKYTGTDFSVVGFKARQGHKSGKGKIACNYLAG